MPIPQIIVSLTSYPKRIEYVATALGPLFRQTIPVDEVILWLPMEELEETGTAIPAELTELEADPRFTIRDCPINLKPHNKYFHVMQERPDDIVITVDDDVVCSVRLVEKLIEMHLRHPKCVVGDRTHRVLKGEGRLLPYANWRHSQNEESDQERFDLLATGVGGVLYPPRVFDPAVFDAEAIKELAFFGDDLWLFVHEHRLRVPVVDSVNPCYFTYIEGSQEAGLYHDNLDNGRNDVMLQALFERFPEAGEHVLANACEAESGQPTGGGQIESFGAKVKRHLFGN